MLRLIPTLALLTATSLGQTDWRRATAESVGLDTSRLTAMEIAIKAGEFKKIECSDRPSRATRIRKVLRGRRKKHFAISVQRGTSISMLHELLVDRQAISGVRVGDVHMLRLATGIFYARE